MMITRKQYLEALEVIDQYHWQGLNKTPIEDWIYISESSPKNNLSKLLINNPQFRNGKPFTYLEDVNEEDFLALKDSTKELWTEFVELSGYNLWEKSEPQED